MLRKRMLFLGLTCLLLIPMIVSAADETTTGPKAFLPEDEYSFDPVLEGTEIVHEFLISNQGDEPLEILKIESG